MTSPGQTSDKRTAGSPLLMAMQDPAVHRFIAYLADKKAEQESAPDQPVRIELSRQEIAAVREAFHSSILDGERHLHVLSHLLASILLGGDFELHSNVIGLLPGDEERQFLIRERITRQTLFSATDIDLGNALLDNFRYQQGRAWMPLKLSANFVEYIPPRRPESGVNRLTSRVKAEEEMWNKVTDELFHVDELVARDKHLRQYSKYVKDIFGIKIVCEDEPTCWKTHARLEKLTVGDCVRMGMLENLAVPVNGQSGCDRFLEFIETKDYLTCPPSQMKKTGWKALKSVIAWNGRLFEIQFQPLGNYYLELDHMAGPSHRSFKLLRDAMRDQLAGRIPLYSFYRNLLKMLFLEEQVCFASENASVVIS